jgi:hypothetical protein
MHVIMGSKQQIMTKFAILEAIPTAFCALTNLKSKLSDDAGPHIPSADRLWSTPTGLRWDQSRVLWPVM